jgi:UrcA family protein
MNTRTRHINVITVTLSSLLGFGAAVGCASNAHADEATAVKVSYTDLNLSQPADVQTLYRRLEKAAASACGQYRSPELARHLAYTRCYDSALESAVTEIRSPELLALDRAAHSGHVS